MPLILPCSKYPCDGTLTQGPYLNSGHLMTLPRSNSSYGYRLVAHKAPDDVTYKPGVDVYGQLVAPADLVGTQVDQGTRQDHL